MSTKTDGFLKSLLPTWTWKRLRSICRTCIYIAVTMVLQAISLGSPTNLPFPYTCGYGIHFLEPTYKRNSFVWGWRNGWWDIGRPVMTLNTRKHLEEKSDIAMKVWGANCKDIEYGQGYTYFAVCRYSPTGCAVCISDCSGLYMYYTCM